MCKKENILIRKSDFLFIYLFLDKFGLNVKSLKVTHLQNICCHHTHKLFFFKVGFWKGYNLTLYLALPVGTEICRVIGLPGE